MGREFIHRTELKQGALIMSDSGFKCIDPNEVHVVEVDKDRGPYIICACGLHWLTGEHIDARGRAIGFYRCTGFN